MSEIRDLIDGTSQTRVIEVMPGSLIGEHLLWDSSSNLDRAYIESLTDEMLGELKMLAKVESLSEKRLIILKSLERDP